MQVCAGNVFSLPKLFHLVVYSSSPSHYCFKSNVTLLKEITIVEISYCSEVTTVIFEPVLPPKIFLLDLCLNFASVMFLLHVLELDRLAVKQH